MKLNLFELIEGFFHGVVYFVYNMFYSIWWTLRHPVKGPLYLYRRYRKEDVEQVGGLTFLFALLFSFFFVMLKLFEGKNVPDFLSDVMKSGEMGGLTIWQSFAFSVVSTVIVDAVIRLYIMLAGPRRIERGKMVLAATEYALIWPLLVLPLAVYAGANIINEDMTDDQLWNRSIQFAVGFLIFFSIASFPAACLLTAGLKRAKRLHHIFYIPGKHKVKPDGWQVLGTNMFNLGMLMTWGLFAAFYLGGNLIDSKIWGDDVDIFKPRYVYCDRQGNQLFVDALIENSSDRRVLLQSALLRVAYRPLLQQNGTKTMALVMPGVSYRVPIVFEPKKILQTGPFLVTPFEVQAGGDLKLIAIPEGPLECRIESILFKDGKNSEWQLVVQRTPIPHESLDK